MTDGVPQPTFSRTHGFQRPWDTLQMVSWGLFAIFLVQFGVFTVPFLKPPLNYVLGSLYLLFSTLSIVFNVLSARSNASDPSIYCKLDDAKLCSVDRPLGQTSCYLCRAYVDKSSKHCRNCNKCVIGFDHHCKWLNNCIGMRNYWIFFSFMTATLVTIVFQLGILTFQFTDSFLEVEFYDTRFRELYGGNVIVFQVIAAVTAALAMVTAALLGRLFTFHIMLTFQKKTTYEWILEQRERKRQMQEKKDFLRLNQGASPGTELSMQDHRCALADNATSNHQATEPQGKGSLGDNNSEEDGTRFLLPPGEEKEKDGQPFLLPRASSLNVTSLSAAVSSEPIASRSAPPGGAVSIEPSSHMRGTHRTIHCHPEGGSAVIHISARHPTQRSTDAASGDSQLGSQNPSAPAAFLAHGQNHQIRIPDSEVHSHAPSSNMQSARGTDTMSVGMETCSVSHPFSPLDNNVGRPRAVYQEGCDLDCTNGGFIMEDASALDPVIPHDITPFPQLNTPPSDLERG